MGFDTKNCSDEDFIEFCYRQILRRPPDESGMEHFISCLGSDAWTREDLLIHFLHSEEFNTQVVSQEVVPSGHFYSVVPSMEDRKEFLAKEPSDEVLAIKLYAEEQFDLLKLFEEYYLDFPFDEQESSRFRFYLPNEAYGFTDAFFLYSMMREFEPKRVVEIGSGYSSALMLDVSEHFLGGSVEFSFVDPHPEVFHSVVKDFEDRERLIPKKLQDLGEGLFRELQDGDFLFVDSSHVSKLGSDVNKIFFQILPMLEGGVFVHFHDIFWPFEYPKDWVRDGFAWNEAYLLRAFLQYNESFEVVLFSSFLHTAYRSWIEEHMPRYWEHPGANLWIRKNS